MDYSSCIMYYLQETNVCVAVGCYDLGIKVSEQSCFKTAVVRVDSLHDSSGNRAEIIQNCTACQLKIGGEQ